MESLVELLVEFVAFVISLKIAAAASRIERRSGRSIVDVVASLGRSFDL